MFRALFWANKKGVFMTNIGPRTFVANLIAGGYRNLDKATIL